jgi:hypothetical protein
LHTPIVLTRGDPFQRSGEGGQRLQTFPSAFGDPPDETGPWYFAWVDATETTFVESTHARVDEWVFSLEIEHKEGDNPTATLEIENPGVGLLASGRLSWMWISKRKVDNTVTPLFFGQVLAIPSNMIQTVVTITLVARAEDQQSRKLALAQTLKVSPYYDEIWVEPSRQNDPDAVLEGYSARWHFDRTTLGVTISDVLEGEDGTLEYLYDDLFWDGMGLTIDNLPLPAVSVRATVNWQQRATGTVAMPALNISTYTGDGFMSDWPKPYSSLGGGWSAGESQVVDALNTNGAGTLSYTINWQNHAKEHRDGDTMSVSVNETYPSVAGTYAMTGDAGKHIISRTSYEVVGTQSSTAIWSADGYLLREAVQGKAASAHLDASYFVVALWNISASLELRYEADRARKEFVNFTLVSDVQGILEDKNKRRKTNSDKLSVNGRDVGKPLHVTAVLHGTTGANVADGDQVLILSDPPYRFQGTLTPGEGHVLVGATLEESLINLTNAINSNGAGIPGEDYAAENAANETVFAAMQGPDSVLLTGLSDSDKILVGTTSPVLEFDATSTFEWTGGLPAKDQVVTVGGVVYTFDESLELAMNQVTLTQTIIRQLPYHVLINTNSVEATLINFAAAINAEGGAGTAYSTGTIQNPSAQAEVTNGVLTVFPRHANADMTMVGPWTLATDHLIPDQNTVPIGDVSRRSYFATDRGQQSLQALICRARAKLRITTRAVKAGFVTDLEKGFPLNCRKNVILNDPRFVGGQAMGKVISYYFKCNGDDGAELAGGEIGCAVGNGNTVADDPGTPTYVDAGYADPGWQMYSSQHVHLGVNDVWYTPPVDTPVTDDGLVFPLTYQQSVLANRMVNRDVDQEEALNRAKLAANNHVENLNQYAGDSPNNIDLYGYHHYQAAKGAQESAVAALVANSMVYELVLAPLDGGPYSTRYEVVLSDLMIPKQIDLSAG